MCMRRKKRDEGKSLTMNKSLMNKRFKKQSEKMQNKNQNEARERKLIWTGKCRKKSV